MVIVVVDRVGICTKIAIHFATDDLYMPYSAHLFIVPIKI